MTGLAYRAEGSVMGKEKSAYVRTTLRLGTMLLLLALITASAWGDDPAYYIRKDSWQETLRQSREALVEHLAKNAGKIESTLPQYGPWLSIGPYKDKKDSFKAEFPPEKELDLTKGDGKKKWRPIKLRDGATNKLRLGGDSAMYLYRKIDAKVPASVMTYYGSDDSIAIWLNGKKIHSNPTSRAVAPNQEKVRLELEQGENHLLVKIKNGAGPAGFYFSNSAKPGAKKDPRQIMRDGLWGLVQRDFDTPESQQQMRWEQADSIWVADWKKGALDELAKRYASTAADSAAGKKMASLASSTSKPSDLAELRGVYYQHKSLQEALAKLSRINLKALRRAIVDLTETYPKKYPAKYLAKMDEIEKKLLNADAATIEKMATELVSFQEEALLANPILDFDKLLFIRRKGKHGMPQNWVGNCSKRGPFDNEIAVLSPVKPGGKITTLYKPPAGRFVGDVDLHWDASKMLFSSQLENRRYEVFEIKADGKGLRQVSKTLTNIDNYDACYLPSGKIIYDSTSIYQGVPCVGGGSQVANLHVMDNDGKNVRRLCFDQDHDWYPAVMNDGKVIFTRWEYSDTPHYFTRIVMTMNPDGTNQRSFYGSNSYWPNSTFYPRAIPGTASKFVGIISGHHGVPREGEFIIFDAAKGQFEADGVVQRIPGYGKKVEPIIRDALVNSTKIRFLHPYPLNEKYHLVSSNLGGKWGIYLVDVFDNMLLIHEEAGYCMLEPVPFRKTKTPPIIPERVDLKRKDAVLHVSDVYTGPGLKGVPRGTVKKMRIFAFDYGYHRLANHTYIGREGPWDVHRILGTVDVEKDGSTTFHVPANTPIALQPLDKEGQSLQLMRSWLVAMPGENLSCVGCHESSNTAPPARFVMASRKAPQKINPWNGPARGFSFRREVQPVVDKNCIACHNGEKRSDMRDNNPKGFSKAYMVLQNHVRRPGPEGDYHIYHPAEYAADTSPLIQMLKKGHHGVKLDAKAYERLYTWIDLNVPFYGTWGEFRKIPHDQHKIRMDYRKKYALVDEDYEVIFQAPKEKIEPIMPKKPVRAKPGVVSCKGWPFDDAEAKKRQGANASRTITVDVDGKSITIEMVRIPAGEFVMGDNAGAKDEYPACAVKIEKSFWIAKRVILNSDYALFDSKHDSGVLDMRGKDHSRRGNPLNRPTQRVIRVSWDRAMEFCEWLSKKSGKKFTLPTEAQWEYVARAGATADKAGSNAWGAGMAASGPEWTKTTYMPYPYKAGDGRDSGKSEKRKVVRGSLGINIPKERIDTYRLDYAHWQPVWNVGFRVVCEE